MRRIDVGGEVASFGNAAVNNTMQTQIPAQHLDGQRDNYGL